MSLNEQSEVASRLKTRAHYANRQHAAAEQRAHDIKSRILGAGLGADELWKCGGN